jgi:hypothetical protein
MAWMKGIKCPSSHLQRASHAAPHLTTGPVSVPATWCVLLGLSWALSLLAVVFPFCILHDCGVGFPLRGNIKYTRVFIL